MPHIRARVGEVWWRLRARLTRDALDRELDRELQFHRELLERDFARAGLSPADASAAAGRRLGSTLRHREASAESWGFPRLESVIQDIVYGARLLRRSPGFAAVAVGATGLAIGVNCGFFTLIDSLVWRPIPVADASSMVKLVTVVGGRQTSLRFSYPEYLDVASQAKTMRDVVAFSPGQVALAGFDGGRRAVATGAGLVSGNYFGALGGSASVGRVIRDEDVRAGATPVAVINHSLWQSAFALAPDVVGRIVVINGVDVTVVGVIRRDFVGINPIAPDIWLPVTLAAQLGLIDAALSSRSYRFLVLHGHLARGASMAQARSEISPLVAEPPAIAGSVAADSRVTGVAVLPQSSIVPMERQTVLVALPGFVIVGLVLVIACANLGSLLLARALARQREVAMRLALGASRRRLMRQLLTESALVALAGGALGMLLANWTVTAVARTIIGLLPVSIGTIVFDLAPSGRVYLFTLLLSVGCVIIFGLVPALQATRLDLTTVIKGEDSAFGTRLRRSRFRDWLVAGQVAACVVLGVAAGTMVLTLRDSVRSETGLHPQPVVVASLGLAEAGQAAPRLAAGREAFALRAARLPGVAASARASAVPFSGEWDHVHVAVRGGPSYAIPHATVTPGYFGVVGHRIVRGRGFSAVDSASGARVAIVTEAAARRLWPGGDGVGRVMHVVRANGSAPDSLIPYEVVGVAADARSGSLWDDPSEGYAYLSATPSDLASGRLVSLIRAAGDDRALAVELDRLAGDVDPHLPLETITLNRLLAAQVVPFRFIAIIATAIGVLGLALAAVGLYGIVSFAVRQRQRDVAVHMAVGAGPRDVLALVLRRELRLILLGLGVGLVLALGEAGLISATAVPVTPLGPTGFAVVALLLLAVALVATLVPARLALKTDPMRVLRQE